MSSFSLSSAEQQQCSSSSQPLLFENASVVNVGKVLIPAVMEGTANSLSDEEILASSSEKAEKIEMSYMQRTEVGDDSTQAAGETQAPNEGTVAVADPNNMKLLYSVAPQLSYQREDLGELPGPNRLHPERGGAPIPRVPTPQTEVDALHPQRPSTPSSGSSSKTNRRYSAETLTSLLLPITLNMLIVILLIKFAMPPKDERMQDWIDRFLFQEKNYELENFRLGLPPRDPLVETAAGRAREKRVQAFLSEMEARGLLTVREDGHSGEISGRSMESRSADSSAGSWYSPLVNGLIMLGLVVVTTVLMLTLYLMGCNTCLFILLSVQLLLIFTILSAKVLSEFCSTNYIPMDWITTAVLCFNFLVPGMLSFFWKAPLRVSQGYAIVLTAILAYTFSTILPEWTCWVALGLLVIWDLVAVLTPCGPLRLLIETAQKRGETSTGIIRPLLYSTTSIFLKSVFLDPLPRKREERLTAGRGSHPKQQAWGKQENFVSGRDAVSGGAEKGKEGREALGKKGQPPPRRAGDDDDEEEEGAKLGLGDFVFYGLLIAKCTDTGDWTTVVACYLAIVVGLAATLVILLIYQRALPALPISITLALIFYFSSYFATSKFVDTLNIQQIMI